MDNSKHPELNYISYYFPNIDELNERFGCLEVFVQSNERNIRVLENKVQDIVDAINELVFKISDEMSEIMSDFDKRITNIESKVMETEDGKK